MMDRVSLNEASGTPQDFNGTVSNRFDNFDGSETTILQDVQCGVSPDEYALVEQLCKNYEPLHAVWETCTNTTKISRYIVIVVNKRLCEREILILFTWLPMRGVWVTLAQRATPPRKFAGLRFTILSKE